MFESILQILRYEPWQALFELAVIGLCVWLVFSFLRGTRGANVIRGFALLLVVTTVVIRGVGQGSDSLARLSFIYERLIGLLALILIVVFQPELRAALIRIGQGFDWRGRRTLARRVVAPVAEAAAWLSKSRFGALIAIERRTKVGELTERGEELDARLSARLLQSIFFPNSPLHDLGVVIRDDRIVAAGVQFPLAEQGALDPSFGSRHRAGVGLSAESDCLVVIVSEEQGTISIAEGGRLEYDIPRDRLAEVLARRLGIEEAPAGTPAPAASSEDLAA
ncbi:MAG: diadenylate cyclase [Phycisphaeraceae bacterium]|nr:diadenylate cyclase [Phycisphaeraceae bacterium]